ncbi:MAG: IS66 family transposase [Acidimicrobiales bacterium]
MVRGCSECRRRDREIARHVAQHERDSEQSRLLTIERDDLRARLERSEDACKQLEGERDDLRARLTQHLRHRFGRRSERSGKSEASGQGADERSPTSGEAPSPENKRRRGQQPGRPAPRRRRYDHLKTEEVAHDFGEVPRCPECDKPYEAFGEETSEELHFEVRIVRRIHRRKCYRRGCSCERTPGIVAYPPPAKPIPKGRLSIGFLARLVFYKYGLGLPLARIVALLAAEGAQFSPASLVGSLDRVGKLLAPLAEAIRAHNATSSHLHVDETSWKVFVLVPGKKNYRHWIWVFVGEDSVAFYLKPSRGRDVVVAHLGLVEDDSGRLGLPGGGELLLSSDFYTTYQSLGKEVEGLVNLWCWAHARRYVLRCGEAHQSCKAWADAWLEAIRALYRAWHACCAAEPGSEEETEALDECRRIVEEMEKTRRSQATDDQLPEPAKKVLSTLDHEWSGLVAFLEHPGVDLDNNRAERHIRGPVVLRKGCYGSRSLTQAALAADAWSIISTIELAGWNPLTVLDAYLAAIARAGGPLSEGELKAFLPWAAPEEEASAFKRAPP